VAYYHHSGSACVTVAALTAAVSAALPRYMVPGYWVLGELPRLANGKVNAHALAEPDWSAGGDAEDSTEPTTPIERELLALFRQLLGTERIGTRTDFFTAGAACTPCTLHPHMHVL
jgi:fengycin family lipopeptide synthetase E